LLVLALTGCSGGGNGDAGSPQDPPGGLSGTGSLDVTVHDTFGAPLPGVTVVVTPSTGTQLTSVSDPSGQVAFRNVREGMSTVATEVPDAAGTMVVAVERGRVQAVDLYVHPISASAGAVLGAWLPNGASADGRTIEIALEIAESLGNSIAFWGNEGDSWSNDGVRVEACVPDPANDRPLFRPDCVAAANGFDSPYVKTGSSDAVETIARLPERTQNVDLSGISPMPFRVVLLIDQGDTVALRDPADQRLFAARYLLQMIGGDSSVAVGAFATDRHDPDGPSLLPHQPVTFFPVENPTFTAGRSHLTTVESLASMEGGASSLFAAIDAAIDLQMSTDYDYKRAIVIVTDGNDETCGTQENCRAQRDALVEKSRATGVAIITVGYDGGTGTADLDTLGRLAHGNLGGAAFWVDSAAQLAPTMRTVHSYLADMSRSAVVTFRLEAAKAGTFAPGRTVLGRVRYADRCPIDCNYVYIPYVVQIN
jgi:hypothetical protein